MELAGADDLSSLVPSAWFCLVEIIITCFGDPHVVNLQCAPSILNVGSCLWVAYHDHTVTVD